MRWVYFLLIAIATILVQNTLVQVVWLPTPLGAVIPVLPAAVAVFVALFAPSAVDAALAGWALGIAADLTGSGPGMGMLGLLYAVAAAGIFRVRGAFFCDRALTQMIMAFVFCVFVYELWLVYQVLLGDIRGELFWGGTAVVLGSSLYTAALTPLAGRLLRRGQRVIFADLRRRDRR